jgi:hypothetical protein
MFLTVAVAMSATAAFAQRDAGAKMSGQFGTGFWARSSPTYRWAPSYVAPAPVITRTAPITEAPHVAATERRSFSVEPNVAAPTTNRVVPPMGIATRATGVRRSFSYEPGPVYYAQPRAVGPRSGAGMPGYMLPKTDARKYGG